MIRMTLFSLTQETLLSHPRMVSIAMSNKMLVPNTSKAPQTSYQESHNLTYAI